MQQPSPTRQRYTFREEEEVGGVEGIKSFLDGRDQQRVQPLPPAPSPSALGVRVHATPFDQLATSPKTTEGGLNNVNVAVNVNASQEPEVGPCTNELRFSVEKANSVFTTDRNQHSHHESPSVKAL